MATGRLSLVSSAWNTVPMPPLPSLAWIRYGPISAPITPRSNFLVILGWVAVLLLAAATPPVKLEAGEKLSMDQTATTRIGTDCPAGVLYGVEGDVTVKPRYWWSVV